MYISPPWAGSSGLDMSRPEPPLQDTVEDHTIEDIKELPHSNRKLGKEHW